MMQHAAIIAYRVILIETAVRNLNRAASHAVLAVDLRGTLVQSMGIGELGHADDLAEQEGPDHKPAEFQQTPERHVSATQSGARECTRSGF